jgi:hypothetical protein
MAPVLKTGEPERVPRVRISPFPPYKKNWSSGHRHASAKCINVGSNPTFFSVLLAQLVRASDCDSEGREFNSHITPNKQFKSKLPFCLKTGCLDHE